MGRRPPLSLFWREEKQLKVGTTRQLLLSHLYQTLRDVTTQRTSFTGSVVTHVTVLWNRYAQFLSSLVLHLLKSCVSLRYDQVVGTASFTVLSCLTHVCHLLRCCMRLLWLKEKKLIRQTELIIPGNIRCLTFLRRRGSYKKPGTFRFRALIKR